MKGTSTYGYKCKCGRPWSAKHVPGKRGYGYDKICDGCLRKTSRCTCSKLKTIEHAPYDQYHTGEGYVNKSQHTI